jgi:hypothetical protein
MSSKLDARLIDYCVDRLNVVIKCRRLSGRLISHLASLAGLESRCVWAADAEPGYVW